VSTHVVTESRWPRSSPSLTPVKSTARARAPISTTSRFAGPQGALATVSRRSPTWSSGIAGDVRRAEFAVTGCSREESGACSNVRKRPVFNTHGPRRLSLVSVQENRGRRIDARAPVEDGGPGVRDDLRQACGVSHRSVWTGKHTTPALPPRGLATASRTYEGADRCRTTLARLSLGAHRHLNRARRGIRSANLDRQKYRPEGGATWL